MSAPPQSSIRRSIRRHLAVGLLGMALLVVVGGGLAATTEIAGAVIGPGELTVESNVKKVQHPDGGVIAELDVHDGDTVTEGEVLLRLDDTTAQAALAAVVKNLQQLEAREARLEAERDGTDAIAYPAELIEAAATDTDATALMAGETKLFDLRRADREGQKAQLNEELQQLTAEIDGDNGQIAARRQQMSLDSADLTDLRPLLSKNLVASSRVSDLERAMAVLDGEISALQSSIAQANGKISQTRLQIIQVDQDMRSQVASDLRDAQSQIAQLVEKRIAAEDALHHLVLRAPQAGRVHELSVHTIGGVAGAGETLMEIVPVQDALTVDFKVSPQDIDQVKVGQPAILRFTAFNQRSTPEVKGTVILVSADLTTDSRTGATYYTGRITPDADQLAPFAKSGLVPGMPVEVFVQTGDRTILNYLTKPLADQVTRAFRSD